MRVTYSKSENGGEICGEKPKQRGGYRPGAGRKAVHGKTKTIRVPEADVELIKAFIAGLHGNSTTKLKAYEAGHTIASERLTSAKAMLYDQTV